MNDENSYAHPNVKAKSSSSSEIMKKKGPKTIEETYTKKTQLEHILLRPDTYIGSVDKQLQQLWVYDKVENQIVFKQINYVPGLYKIFDEIIVNAADNKQRDKTMSKIEVEIDEVKGSIRVWNNGNGIPVALHKEHQIYVPELIFGQLLTGSNFDDNESKTTGGRNGYGAKLANIFSTKFIIETADRTRGLKYKQVFTNNMNTRADPEIVKYTGEDFTCVTFYPDLVRFKMEYLDEDIVSLLSKRVYDIAGTSQGVVGSKLSVVLNKKKLDVKSFESYIEMYGGLEAPVAFEKDNEKWEVGVGASDGSFQQVSFVNSISTMKGGCHVNYIADQITAKLMPIVKRKNKGEEVKANQIKNHLSVYVNALIINPAFSSQTKDVLTTIPLNFGSTFTVSEKFMKQVEKSGIIENILNWAKYKQTAELKKKSGSKRSKIVGITKLDDANFAGTAKSIDCTLILTEGDSAKALAISGLGVVGRDYYGVFPLKGKLLNVREASHQQIMKNEEIQNISKILGLTFGKVYTDLKDLRYGHLMIMTDQDHDGSHIKGLLINFLHHFWPSLLKMKGFLQQFITPIVKCIKGKKELCFYTIPEYNNWREETGDIIKSWKIKYYKGLGTSTSAEAKEYFSNLQTHEIDFRWDERADDMIDMAFAKKRVEDRKLWLLKMEAGVHIDYKVADISYDDFINHELILFSNADNERSIPNFMDGLKPSQRKVLFCCFKRNLRQEIKVAQLAGYISEHSAYHHGEASLTQTIIGMAQNFIGSNNINLLSPCGQFGTRLMGGKDAASPRYVFTKLEAITRCIFHPNDDPLLDYLDDDGQSIEPLYYVPIIPMALVNGSEGIGTGWSSSVPTYNPRQIISNLKKMIAGEEPEKMVPWFRGFNGEVSEKAGTNNFTVSGKIEQLDETTVVISELPVGKWTTDYKQFLESLLIGNSSAAKDKDDTAAAATPFIKDFKENHTDTSVLFTVTIPADKLAEINKDNKGGLAKKFKLDGSVSTTNMHMFDVNSTIRKFESPLAVMQEFYNVRVEFYDRRKVHLTNKLTEEWEKLDNKMRFVLAVIKGTLIVNNRKKDELLLELQKKGFKPFNNEADKQAAAADDNASLSSESTDSLAEAVTSSSSAALDKGYDYLLSMKIWSLTMEKVAELSKQRDAKRTELDLLNSKTAEMLWLDDLDALEAALCRFEGEIEEGKRHEIAARKKAKNDKAAKSKSGAGNKQKAKPVRKNLNSDDEGDDEDDDADASDFEEEAAKRKKKIAAPKPAAASKSAASSSSSSSTAPKAVSAPAVSVSVSSSSASAPAAKVKPEKAVKVPKEKKPAAASATSSTKPITQFFKKKPAKKSDDDDDSDAEDDDEDEFQVVSAPSNRAPRAAAVAAKTKAVSLYRIDSEDDGEGDDEQPSFDFIETDSDAGSHDYSDIKAIKAAAKKKPAAAAPKRQLKAAASFVTPSLVALSMTSSASASASAAVVGRKGSTAAVKKGTKRGAHTKDSDEDDDADSENDGDGGSAMEVAKALPQKKKLKKAPSPAKNQTAKQTAKQADPKAKPMKRSIKKPVVVDVDDDDDEEEEEVEDDGVVDLTSSRAPSRPARQTKQQALKRMVVEASDDDEESEFEESD